MDLTTAIQAILDGEALLFLGAGFSHGATNVRDKPFMPASALRKHFATLSDLPKETALEDAAEMFAEDKGVDALIREIADEFTAKDVCDYHRALAKLPWKRIYTTNYDNVFELAAQRNGKRVTPVTLSSNVYTIPKDQRICVHLNGYIDLLDRTRILHELKLTDTSYVTTAVQDSEWAMLFRQDIRIASSIFFIGYSLYDLDIKRILAESDDIQEKLFFYIGQTPDLVTERRVARYGLPVKASTEDCAIQVQDIANTYIPKDNTSLRLLSVREVITPTAPARITDSAFIDLLRWGQRSESLISESLRTDKAYFLERDKIPDALDMITNGKRILVVSSDVANGKSMFLEGLRLRAIERGYRVFDVFDNNEGVERELEAIARTQDRVLVTVEDYHNWLDEIRVFCTTKLPDAVLVLTARNAVHDVVIDDLFQLAGDIPIAEINIDELSLREAEWFADALGEYGLWGDRAALGRRRHIKLIREECGSQIHALLLKMLESPDIGQRVSEIAERIRSKGENYDILLSVFLLTQLGCGPTLDVLTDIWGAERIGRPQFRTDPVVRELVSFNYYAIRVRSPIAAEYVLKSFSDARSVVAVLQRMAERIEKGRNVGPRYKSLFKNLMRFSSMQMVLPEKGRRNAIIEYYEHLKNLRGCKSNPLFWLQYAIASLVIEDRVRAQTYFETAYALAKDRGWDTYQIDNHFSRFLMVQAVEDLDFDAAIINYRGARAIIDRQIRDERRHYPYRVAILLQDFL